MQPEAAGRLVGTGAGSKRPVASDNLPGCARRVVTDDEDDPAVTHQGDWLWLVSRN